MEDIFWEVHSGLPQEGPGSDRSTLKALSIIRKSLDMDKNTQSVLDVGCGPGRQSLALAKNLQCTVTAVDTHQPFLDDLNIKADANALSDKIETVNASMGDLPYENEKFDLIWSEGAIYIIGLTEGLNHWRKFINRRGFICITHISWLTDSRPEEIVQYWKDNYPQITTISENIKEIESLGLKPLDHFILPDSDWHNYYRPIENKLKILREKYRADKKALEYLDIEEEEISLFNRFSKYYGYVFYLIQS